MYLLWVVRANPICKSLTNYSICIVCTSSVMWCVSSTKGLVADDSSKDETVCSTRIVLNLCLNEFTMLLQLSSLRNCKLDRPRLPNLNQLLCVKRVWYMPRQVWRLQKILIKSIYVQDEVVELPACDHNGGAEWRAHDFLHNDSLITTRAQRAQIFNKAAHDPHIVRIPYLESQHGSPPISQIAIWWRFFDFKWSQIVIIF